jgi:hypothetical protein
MTIVAQLLFLLAATGVLAPASKYCFRQAPISYQTEMLEKAGSIPDDMTQKVLAPL